MIDVEVQNYIEKEILPCYKANDWAHQLWHIEGVIQRSIALAKTLPVDLTKVYIIAAFHDIGSYINRKKHEQIAWELLSKDSFLLGKYTTTEIECMKEAVEDHRGSSDHEPRSIYGKIVATADRFTDIDDILTSIHYFTLENDSTDTWEEMVKNAMHYLKQKYGIGGYAKVYIYDPTYEKFLKEVDYYLHHSTELENRLRKIDAKIREEKQLPLLQEV